MSGEAKEPHVTIPLSLSANAERVRTQFEDRWQEALRGGSAPEIETFLQLVADPERPALYGELMRIQKDYRRRQGETSPDQTMAQTHSELGMGDTNPDQIKAGQVTTVPESPPIPPGEGATVVHAPPPGATIDLHTSNIKDAARTLAPGEAPPPNVHSTDFTLAPGLAAAGATVEFGPAKVDPGATLAPGQKPTQSPNRSGGSVGREFPYVEGYEILSELGRGGMGVVYKARQTGLRRIVALKMVLAGAHAGSAQLQRFQIEAEAVARLQHPNIVQIYDVGERNGLPFFSLEFVDGGPLDEKIAGKPRPIEESAQLVETVAKAMLFAHDNGIVHRDLKPANILVASDGSPKITDFGLAKRLEEADSGQTKSGTIMGTPSYMSPEQAKGEIRKVGPLSDVYSLGAILYELLTGRAPFVGSSAMDTVNLVINQEPVPPSRLRPDLPSDLETICLKCLQKEPHKRYANCFELAGDLRRFQLGEPIRARPVGNAERLWSWCRRNPRIAIMTGAIAVLLVAISIGSAYAAITINEEKKAAVEARDLAEKRRLEAEYSKGVAETKKKEAEDARHVADERSKVAAEQARVALNTIYTMSSQAVSQLDDAPKTQEVKKNLLKIAMSCLEQVDKAGEGKIFIETTMANAIQRMGMVYMQLGDFQEAMKQFQRLYDISERRFKENPNNDASKGNMALAYVMMGNMRQALNRDIAAALEYYKKALQIRKELLEDPKTPKDGVGYLDPKAVKQQYAYDNLIVGATIIALGDPRGSRDYFRESLKHYSELAQQDPGNLGLRRQIASVQNALAEVSFRSNDMKEAQAYYDDCIKLRQTYYNNKKDDLNLKKELGEAYLNYGDFELYLTNLEGAAREYGRLLQIAQELTKADDKNVYYQRLLGQAYYRQGVLAQVRKDPSGSDNYFRQCRQIRQRLCDLAPANDKWRIELMLALAHCGEHDEAAKLAAKFRQSKAKDAEVLVDLARGYAQCALVTAKTPKVAQVYSAKAIEAIRQAMACGYKDVVYLEREPDLEPVRVQPEFQELLKKLRTQKTPA